MAFKRRVVAVLFMTALVVGLLWSCYEVVQTDRLSEEDQIVQGRALPVELTSAHLRHDAPNRAYLKRRLEREENSPSNEFMGGERDDPREAADAVEGEYRYYLETNKVPKPPNANGKKSLQAVYNDLPENDDSLDSQAPGTEVLVSDRRHQSGPVSQTSLPSDPAMLQLLRERKKMELRLENDAQEMWWYLRAQLNTLRNGLPPHDRSPQISNQRQVIERMSKDVEERYDALRSQLRTAEEATDNLLWPHWKDTFSSSLGELLYRRLQGLQNPRNCSHAKKLVCNIAKTCGFGCQIHHVAYCFIMAYATERMLVINSRGWQYSDHGWESVFLPLSATCTRENLGISTPHPWRNNIEHFQVISLPNIEGISPKPAQLPQAVPRDLADQLMTFHGYPFVWFIGHFISYLMRPNRELQEYISGKRKAMAFSHPIVGVHVRRTDKIKSEAKLHEINEYMDQVEEWYASRERQHGANVTRQVFLASDDPRVLEQAKSRYPQYKFVSNRDIASSAGLKTRYTTDSLYGVIFDVMTLAESDYVVCTFSSQVCRLAYELMQTYHVDASHNFYSLDDVYYFGGQQKNNVRALQSHKAQNAGELSFAAGDLIGIAGNEKNGLSVGTHHTSRRRGFFPSYKVEHETVVADFPTYPGIS